MPTYVETPCRALPAGSGVTINPYLRVILNSSGQLALAGANDFELGVLDEAAFVQGVPYPVRLASAQGTFPCVASGAIAQGAPIFGDAGGKVTANATPVALGYALKAATANNDIIEGLRVPIFSTMDPNNYRNVLDGGDFQTNPWQRGNSITGITNSVTYGPDRWFAIGGASSSIDLIKTADTGLPGFSQALKWARHVGNADTAAINLGQVCETTDSIRMQGQKVTFSFWAKAGATYANGAVTAKVISGTGTDDTAANMASAAWAGQANVVSGTFTPTTSWVRYQFTGTVAATATQLGVLLSLTPTGTAGATDNILFHGFQLEVGPEASPYEFKDVAVELEIAQRYYYQINETNGPIFGAGMITATNVETVVIALPVQMRAAPTVGVTAGGFKFNIAGTLTAVGGGFAAGSTHTVNAISVVGAVTATVANATQLVGSATTGKITITADY